MGPSDRLFARGTQCGLLAQRHCRTRIKTLFVKNRNCTELEGELINQRSVTLAVTRAALMPSFQITV